MFISYHDLEIEQHKDLNYKIDTAIRAISAALKVCHHRPALAFSGGKDSVAEDSVIYVPEEEVVAL
jgi:3'-phosphoadenosine 5'-phosphosulfate sulfotransferase (PAPS reductase)/FAD synthetase